MITVSISTDSRITEWNISKGLSHTDIMPLKRVASSVDQDKEAGGTVSSNIGGLCFDFVPGDSSIYYAGTGEWSHNDSVLDPMLYDLHVLSPLIAQHIQRTEISTSALARTTSNISIPIAATLVQCIDW